MKTPPILRTILATVLLLFGVLTLFLSTSVIFDLFGIREREGNYVPVVVWANFIASILYVLAAVGLLAQKRWPPTLLLTVVLVLVAAGIAFGWHVLSGGLHEQKTIGALTFRTLFTLGLYFGARHLTRSSKQPLQPTRP
ncbi:MAG: hypothetical protein IPN85_08465 [Flavobacteriales bacterium]|nr:hypothetical protein [Flavobacteriales bacterium]MBK9288121.1 hypothetical protein [Flavobacteriales bacterium]MBL0036901.1 hypothetical protein [Flavobacteriales bacterium]